MKLNARRNRMDFDSPADMVAFWLSRPDLQHNEAGDHWYGQTREEGIRFATLGDTSGLAEAQKLIDSLEINFETPAIHAVASVHGGVPIVGEYLSGEPECMRTLEIHESANAPIRIYADNGSSSSISHGDLLTRGVSILALVLQLSRVRPVEFYVTDHGNAAAMPDRAPNGKKVEACVCVTRCDILSGLVGTAIFACVNPGFTRRFAYQSEASFASSDDGVTAGRGWGRYTPFGPDGRLPYSPDYAAGARWHLELAPEDLFIPGAHCDDECIRNPASWLAGTLKRLLPPGNKS